MPRRTQEARREDTRLRLLRATIDLLRDRGYSRLTTPEIAAAAGVSRGALTHHFANKEDIVVSAVAFQLHSVTEGLRRICEAHPSPTMKSDELVDYLWEMMANGLFYVTMEYLPEARHNEAFRERMRPVVREFHEALDACWTRLSLSSGIKPEDARVTLNATMCLMRGMIAQTVLRADPAYYEEILRWWKQHLRNGLGLTRAAA